MIQFHSTRLASEAEKRTLIDKFNPSQRAEDALILAFFKIHAYVRIITTNNLPRLWLMHDYKLLNYKSVIRTKVPWGVQKITDDISIIMPQSRKNAKIFDRFI